MNRPELAKTTIDGGGDGSAPTDCAASVGVLASRINATCLSVLLFSQAAVGTPIAPSCTVNVAVRTAAAAAGTMPNTSDARASTRTVHGAIRRIDATHTAPKNAWLAQGMPQWPTAAQKQQMFEASIMQKERLPISAAGTHVHGVLLLTFGVEVRANSVVAVQVPLGGETDVLAAELQRDRRAALAQAETRLAEAAAEVEALKSLLFG